MHLGNAGERLSRLPVPPLRAEKQQPLKQE
jgi:hypothetical protein|nr:MAG TPA: hypothetical protein [Caudoviricetes sp.]